MIFKKATYHEPVSRIANPNRAGGRPKVKNSIRHQFLLGCGTLLVGECLQAPIRLRSNIRTYVMAANRELYPSVFVTRTGEKIVSVIRVA